VAAVLGQEQEPFWLTGGAIALSNLGTTPPAEAITPPANSRPQIEPLTWADLIIEDTLREKLQTYCEILIGRI
jgi:hypothetical protein